MRIEYAKPLTRGWDRMKKALFKPFDMRKWFVVGFTAFLAGATDFSGGGSGKGSSKYSVHEWDELFRLPSEAKHWLAGHPAWTALIFAGVIAVVVLSVVLIWISSRGKFMFLDNVARDKSRVTVPWHEYRPQGNSLFGLRLALGIIAMAVFSAYLVYCYFYLRGCYDGGHSDRMLLLDALTLGLGLFAMILIAGYLSIFIEDFIVPVMAKKRSATMPAVRDFWELFKEHPGEFLLYGLMVFFLKAVVVFLVVISGLMTCCIGFLVLAVPYIGSVVLLPVSYTFRAFSLEFLAQFGREYNLFAPAADARRTRSVKKAASKVRAKRKGTGRL
jgi:hypothetical protein